jgi:hypothetical protein
MQEDIKVGDNVYLITGDGIRAVKVTSLEKGGYEIEDCGIKNKVFSCNVRKSYEMAFLCVISNWLKEKTGEEVFIISDFLEIIKVRVGRYKEYHLMAEIITDDGIRTEYIWNIFRNEEDAVARLNNILFGL